LEAAAEKGFLFLPRNRKNGLLFFPPLLCHIEKKKHHMKMAEIAKVFLCKFVLLEGDTEERFSILLTGLPALSLPDSSSKGVKKVLWSNWSKHP